MNKLFKCVISVIISVVIMVNCFPMVTYADKNKFISIYVKVYDEKEDQAVTVQYKAIEGKDDILFSGEDLSYLTGYEYAVNRDVATFTRGAKTITIDLKENTLECFKSVSTTALENEVVSEDDILYYPAAEMLPWLNVSCEIDDGVLYIFPDLVSVWDFISEFDEEMDSFLFDFETCCEELDIDSTWTQTLSFLRSNGISGIAKHMIWIPGTAHSYGAYEDYYDIFVEMVEQTDSVIEVYEEMTDLGKIANATFSLVEAIDSKIELPDELEAVRTGAKLSSSFSTGLEFASFYQSFYSDNKEKLMWMDSITGNRMNYDYPDAILQAAFDIETNYRDVWDGVEVKIAQFLVDESIDGLITAATGDGIAKTVLKGIGLGEVLVTDVTKDLNKIPYYNKLASCGINVYKENREYGFSHPNDIEFIRANACLYLYASSKNWETMASYASKEGFVELSEEYEKKAEKANEWIAKFILSSESLENDSFKYGEGIKKELYTEELKEIFLSMLMVEENIETPILVEEIAISIVSEAELKEKIETKSGHSVNAFKYGDFNKDGKYEMFAYLEYATETISTGSLSGENGMYEIFNGNFEVWYADANNAELIDQSYTGICEGVSIEDKVWFEDIIYFTSNEVMKIVIYEWGYEDYAYYYVLDDLPYKLDVKYGYSLYPSKDLSSTGPAWAEVYKEGIFFSDSGEQYDRWTFIYVYPIDYIDGKFVTCKAKEISKEAFLLQPGTEEILNQIESKIYELDFIDGGQDGEKVKIQGVSFDNIIYNEYGTYYINYKVDIDISSDYITGTYVYACLKNINGKLSICSVNFGKYDKDSDIFNELLN